LGLGFDQQRLVATLSDFGDDHVKDRAAHVVDDDRRHRHQT